MCFGANLLNGQLPSFGTAKAAIQQRHMNTRAPEDVNSFVTEVMPASMPNGVLTMLSSLQAVAELHQDSE